ERWCSDCIWSTCKAMSCQPSTSKLNSASAGPPSLLYCPPLGASGEDSGAGQREGAGALRGNGWGGCGREPAMCDMLSLGGAGAPSDPSHNGSTAERSECT